MFEQTQQDLKDFSTLIGQFWKRVPDDKWQIRTGSRDKDWTLHETLAHVLSIAQTFNKAADAAMRGEAMQIKDFDTRDDLSAWNDEQIARLTQSPPNGLIVQYLQELRMAHEKVLALTEETAYQTVHLPNFNRAAPAIDYIHWQISHAGVIHGAQVVVPLNREPLWTEFSSDFTHRVMGYYLQQWSMAYWNDMGPEEAQAINFHVNGDGGGAWHIMAAPDGGSTAEGAIEGGEYDLFFASPHILFSVFTNHISMREAMVSGQMRLASDVRDTMNMVRLFAPKRPKLKE